LVWPGVAHLERAAAEGDPVAVLQQPVRARRPARLGQRDLAVLALLQEPGAGHVVGMDVRLERPQQCKIQLGDQRRVAPHLLEHRIDQHRFLARRAAQQIGVGRRGRIEQLAEDEHRFSFSGPRHSSGAS